MIEPVPWIVLPVIIPLAAGVLVVLLGRRRASIVAILAGVAILAAVMCLTVQVFRTGVQSHAIGGWDMPLGIHIYADGLTVLMLIMSAVTGLSVSVYAHGYFRFQTQDKRHAQNHGNDRYFWTLWLFLWAALNALFLSADIFNLYVTLELLTLSSAALVTLNGDHAALRAGMRYLLTSLLASFVFLMGIAFLYRACGTLSLPDLAMQMKPEPVIWIAVALITVGLLLKTALFPLHFWLPPAHSSAPAPVSAILSGLVVKASFYIIIRLWFYVFFPFMSPFIGYMMGGLGAAAILWGSWLAFRQKRLKLLIAYSTVAQIGYLFLLFPLNGQVVQGVVNGWEGGIIHALAHAFAKASMFMTAGGIVHTLGHDRIEELTGITQYAPITVFSFALAGVSLMGLPPSGGFIAKWILLQAALQNGQWWWAAVMIGGGLMAGGYLFMVLKQMFVAHPEIPSEAPVPNSMRLPTLGLALCALAIGFLSKPIWDLLQVGAPFLVRQGWEGLP